MKLQRLKCLQKLCYDLNISRTQLFLFVAMLFCVTIGLWMLFRRVSPMNFRAPGRVINVNAYCRSLRSDDNIQQLIE